MVVVFSASLNGEDARERLSQTGHFSILIDEADSVLIDESTTPLVLSGPPTGEIDVSLDAYLHAKRCGQALSLDEDYELDSANGLLR